MADEVEDVSITDYPWIVALIRPTSSNTSSIHCSGSILNKRWILTAAHCLDDLDDNATSKFQIKVGTDDWGDQEEDYFTDSYEQDHKIDHFVVHPNYSSSTHYFDIALIETQDDISFDEGVQPICLPSTPTLDPDNRKNHKVEVAGFGFSSKENQGLCTDYDNTKLRATTLSIYGYKFCNDSIGPDNLGSLKAEKVKEVLPMGFQPNIICAGSEKKWNKICKGDSGAPLFTFEPTLQGGYFEQVAVAGGEVRDIQLGFYSRLDDFEVLNWINEVAFGEALITTTTENPKTEELDTDEVEENSCYSFLFIHLCPNES